MHRRPRAHQEPHLGIAHGATEAAQALGIDRAAFNQLVAASSGTSFGFNVYARLPSPAAFSVGAPLLVKDVRLLNAILPGQDGAELLRAAAHPFLHEATGEAV